MHRILGAEAEKSRKAGNNTADIQKGREMGIIRFPTTDLPQAVTLLQPGRTSCGALEQFGSLRVHDT
ncbi:Hypothetical protein NTJ_12495 [Nesidiocoris tenuis]|uniref:Uncharacterized protein n=1 Tax=Nesidiocoris tenuis TaxID=355587 RepID=A0ABN7B5Y8_9HEMI|nr:Hypothetical protein NTJ_12495 [Nesidiocoris tenuis]